MGLDILDQIIILTIYVREKNDSYFKERYKKLCKEEVRNNLSSRQKYKEIRNKYMCIKRKGIL